MKKSEQLNDRSAATVRAALPVRIDVLLELLNIFKTQPFSAAC